VRSNRGRPVTIPEREYIAALIGRFLVGCPWRELPRSLSRSGMLDRLRSYQTAGVWDKIVTILNDAGHLPSLTV
jgi:hypothetical protein